MIYSLLVGNLLMAGVFLLKAPTIPPQIPLLYSRAWGEDQITDWWLIFLLPALMNGLYFLNNYIYQKIFAPDEFIKKIFTYLNIFQVITMTIVFIKIIFLVS